jgi:hypothetical protein
MTSERAATTLLVYPFRRAAVALLVSPYEASGREADRKALLALALRD